MQQGLAEIEQQCAARGVGFIMRRAVEGEAEGEAGREDVARFCSEARAALVVGDENPLRGPEAWREHVAAALSVPFWTVDADVIVPSRLLEKAQFSAGVARPRLYRALREFLQPYENAHAARRWSRPRGLWADDVGRDITRGWSSFDRSVRPVEAWRGGPEAANARLQHFVGTLLRNYERDRNRPEIDGTSALSPYLHFGHIGPQSVALAVDDAVKNDASLRSARDAFFNELIVWRELAVNFVRYQPAYDSPACADNWARLTMAEHDRDERAVRYTLARMESARTGDELWNAAQTQMLRHGWMHNYLRMYWAKKIVEWTPNAATAMRTAIHLNDRYFLDGRDPNGYAGVAWAVLGKFDRAWGERPIFGKRRYMSGESTGRKFDARRYIEQMNSLPE
jgi:deoxyribodipyrimidine photo-lyase